MKLDIEANPAVWWVTPLRFTWDSEAGTLEGPDAEKVHGMVREALMVGAVPARPDRCWIPIHDPLHDPAEMALVIGELHVLPPALAAHYPSAANPRPPGPKASSTVTDLPERWMRRARALAGSRKRGSTPA
jgi:hypothetical protein